MQFWSDERPLASKPPSHFDFCLKRDDDDGDDDDDDDGDEDDDDDDGDDDDDDEYLNCIIFVASKMFIYLETHLWFWTSWRNTLEGDIWSLRLVKT